MTIVLRTIQVLYGTHTVVKISQISWFTHSVQVIFIHHPVPGTWVACVKARGETGVRLIVIPYSLVRVSYTDRY